METMAVPCWSEPCADLRLVGGGADHDAYGHYDTIAYRHPDANGHVYGGNSNPNGNGHAHRNADSHTNASLYVLICLQCLP
jgi:hypothetical protein